MIAIKTSDRILGYFFVQKFVKGIKTMTNTELILELSKLGSANNQTGLISLIKGYDNPVIWEAIRQSIGLDQAIDSADIYMMAIESTSRLRQFALWSSAS